MGREKVEDMLHAISGGKRPGQGHAITTAPSKGKWSYSLGTWVFKYRKEVTNVLRRRKKLGSCGEQILSRYERRERYIIRVERGKNQTFRKRDIEQKRTRRLQWGKKG